MITANNLRKIFHDGAKEVQAIDGVSFTVPAGKLFTLLGPSGCGKTTTLRCIAGLETPSDGEIAIGNKVVFAEKLGCSRATQQTQHRHGVSVLCDLAAYDGFAKCLLSAEEQGLCARRSPGSRAQGARIWLDSSILADRPAPKLSGGQQQRVALARALAGDPEVLLLDEPLSNLDAKLREEMRTGIRALQKRIQITSLYVTHDQIEALTMSDQIAIMNAGKIVEIGSPQDIYLRPQTRFAANFIGMTNIIPGQTKDAREGLCVVQTSLGEIHCRVDESRLSDDKVLILVRPESVHLSSHAQITGKNIWPGKIKGKVFMGDYIDCEVACDGLSLRAKIDPYSDLRETDKVYVSVDPSRCAVIPLTES